MPFLYPRSNEVNTVNVPLATDAYGEALAFSAAANPEHEYALQEMPFSANNPSELLTAQVPLRLVIGVCSATPPPGR